ncbi:MAG: type II toxin-antitoxin system HicA family toxin [Elusimicrobiota bacterium]|nr:type II toxin-antitoxin system HicA family toxin [Elusimicrobiota bacterium]
MKRREFIRELTKADCVLHRQGKRHEIWRNPANNHRTSVPRHAELRDTLCKEIRVQLGLEVPD